MASISTRLLAAIDHLTARGVASPSLLRRVLVGVGITAIALGARLALTPVLGNDIPWVTSFIAVLLAAVLAGPVGGFTTVVLCAMGGTWLFVTHRGAVTLGTPANVASIASFLVNAGLMAGVGSVLRAAVARLNALREEAATHAQHAEQARTAVEKALSRVTAQEKRKDEFLAMLGHELRNPLAAIRAAIEVVRRKGGTVTPRLFQVVDRQSATLARIVDDLLDVARITHGKIELRREPTALQSVIARAVDSVKELVEEKRHRLQLELPEAQVFVHGDPVRLEQVLVNLLTNAAKYTPPGGQLSVRVQVHSGRARVSVRDDGAGMQAELVRSVFELFEQGDRTLDRSAGGLGIGLTIVRRIIELHDGTVTASSEGEGKGSELVVELPIIAAPAGAATLAQEIAGPRSRVTKALVVDDNDDAAEGLADLVESLGCSVRVAHDGPAALELAKSFGPDVVLLDLGLPEMDGYEVARRLQEMGTRAQLIAVTGYGQPSDIAQTRAAGFHHHLVKPVPLQALILMLDEAQPVANR